MADPETVMERIQLRLDALGISARQASKLATGSPGTISNIAKGQSEAPRWPTLVKLGHALQCRPEWLQSGAPPMLQGDSEPIGPPTIEPPRRGNVRRADVPFPSNLGQLPRDVPVLGTVAGAELGKGAFQLTSDVVDYVRRPYGLLGVSEVYALYVEGESMVPKFEPGDLVFVHPGRRPKVGDYVVIQEPDTDNGEPRGFIKRLVALTGKLIKTEQFNPKAHLDFVIRPGVKIHKVLTEGELYGT